MITYNNFKKKVYSFKSDYLILFYFPFNTNFKLYFKVL